MTLRQLLILLCIIYINTSKIFSEDYSVNELVKLLNLKPHPEGGFYAGSFKSKGVIPKSVLPNGYHGDRNYVSAIYSLLPEGSKSKLHKLPTEEIFHFYLGGPMTIVQISPTGVLEKIILGQNLKDGQKLQHAVPANYWFGAWCNVGSNYTLFGATVAPGFNFKDFVRGNKHELLEQYPHAKDIIKFIME